MAFLWTVTFELLCIYETALVLVIKLRRIPVGFHTSSASFDLRFCFLDSLLSFSEAYPLGPDLYAREEAHYFPDGAEEVEPSEIRERSDNGGWIEEK